MSLLRIALERASRRLVLARHLPAELGRRRLWVTPGAALTYYRPLSRRRWRELFEFAEHCVAPGECAWDIGANLGIFAFAAAHCAGTAGEVLAVEADPWLADLMRRSATEPAAGAAPVQVLACAAAAGIGLENFLTPERGLAGSHLSSAAGSGVGLLGGVRATNPVVTVSLDWLAARRRPPQAIKIDVEGAELAVLEGGRELLRTHRPRLYVEVYEKSADAITAVLHDAGYDLFNYGEGWIDRFPVDRAVYHTLALPRGC